MCSGRGCTPLLRVCTAELLYVALSQPSILRSIVSRWSSVVAVMYFLAGGGRVVYEEVLVRPPKCLRVPYERKGVFVFV